jgi:hypothetical protein
VGGMFERLRRARVFRLVLAGVLIALSVTSCDQNGDDGEQEPRSLCPAAERHPASPTRPGIIVLDDAGRLTRFSVPGADAVTTRRLPAPPELPGVAGARLGLPGRYLAKAPSGTEIVMLQRDEAVRLRQIDLTEGGPSKPLGQRAPQAVMVEVGDAAP